MRIFIFAAVSVAATLGVVRSHKFSNCPNDMPGGGTTGTVPFTSIILSPDPPEAGARLKVAFTTDPVKQTITGGHGLFTVKLHGIQLVQEKIDICSEMGLSCPISSGKPAIGNIEYMLPSTKFPSYLDLDCFFQVVDETGETLDCVYFIVNEADTTKASFKMNMMSKVASIASDTPFIEEETALQLYKNWKILYKEELPYFTKVEDKKRFLQFADNLQMVDAHNRRYKNGEETYLMTMNAFSHLSWKEFRLMYIGGYNTEQKNETPVSIQRDVHCVNKTSVLPKSFDWSKKGAVTAIKNQGQCGSCWAFSTTGSIEGAYFLKTGNLRSLSEQQLVDCDRKKDDGCNGGLMDNAFDFVASNGGLCQESDYPYTAIDGTCRTTCKDVSGTTVTKHTDVEQTEEALMSAITQQPVSVAIEADQRGFQFYSSGVFSGSCGTKLDHGVLAVGFGSQIQIVNKTTVAQPYWIVKNSWGKSWGSNGYINLERGKNQTGGQCGILMSASYPTL